MTEPDLIAALGSIGRSVFAPAGTELFRRGDAASAVYTIRQGQVALDCCGSGMSDPLETFGSGAIVGIPSAFNGFCSVTARVVEDAELVFVPVNLFVHMLDCDARLLRQAAQLLGREVVRLRAYILSHAEREAKASPRERGGYLIH